MPLILLMMACGTCPEGFERSGGMCSPVSPDTPIDLGPLTSERFQDSFEREACKALEDCVCDEVDVDDCELDCDSTGDWSWTSECTFDPEQGEACLDERWECDVDGDVVYAETPAVCMQVYDCGSVTETGDTGSTLR